MKPSHRIKEMQIVIDNWRARAEKAEAELARLREQEPIGKVRLGEHDDCGNYPDAAVVCLHESAHWDNFPEGYTLYAAPPAPVVKVPDEMPKAAYEILYSVYPESAYRIADEIWSACRAEVLKINSEPEGIIKSNSAKN